jgi:GMP synthase-like glutamine amidotransferase
MPRVTIIETGLVSPKNRDRHGSFPQMLERMIGAEDKSISFDIVRVAEGETLPDANALEAILITGSSVGVYDALDWITPLENFVRAVLWGDKPGFHDRNAWHEESWK